MLHRHHIIPRHAGGTDDPSNIVFLTVEQHARAHLELFEKYGKIEDRLAYEGLMGIVSKQEIVRQLCAVSKGAKWYFNPLNPEEKRMLHEGDLIPDGWIPGRGVNTWSKKLRGAKRSVEAKSKTSETLRKRWEEGNTGFATRKKATITDARRKAWENNRGSKREKKLCPHCHQLIPVNAFPRWHGDNCKHKTSGG